MSQKSKPNLEQFLSLLKRVKELSDQLEDIKKEVKDNKISDERRKERIDEISIILKDLEIANKYVQDHLDKSFKWILTIVSITLSLLITLLGITITFIIRYLIRFPVKG